MFRAMGIRAYAFYDKKKRKPENAKKITDNFDVACETSWSGAEKLLTEELPVALLWEFLSDVGKAGEREDMKIPDQKPSDAEVKKLTYDILKADKGSGYAGRLIGFCSASGLPRTILRFLVPIYGMYQHPARVRSLDGEEPNRSAGTEILTFARDVLHGRTRGSAYQGISHFAFNNRPDERSAAIRRTVGRLRTLLRTGGNADPSIALISSYGSAIEVISAALRSGTLIQHRVVTDEAELLLSARIGAYMLEPKHPDDRLIDIATVLELMANGCERLADDSPGRKT